MAEMTSDLTSVPLDSFEKKKKRWWQFWKNTKTHYRATYEIRFRIKPAGLDFELWFANRKYNDPAHFKVQWEEAGTRLRAPKEHRQSTPHGSPAGVDANAWNTGFR